MRDPETFPGARLCLYTWAGASRSSSTQGCGRRWIGTRRIRPGLPSSPLVALFTRHERTCALSSYHDTCSFPCLAFPSTSDELGVQQAELDAVAAGVLDVGLLAEDVEARVRERAGQGHRPFLALVVDLQQNLPHRLAHQRQGGAVQEDVVLGALNINLEDVDRLVPVAQLGEQRGESLQLVRVLPVGRNPVAVESHVRRRCRRRH